MKVISYSKSIHNGSISKKNYHIYKKKRKREKEKKIVEMLENSVKPDIQKKIEIPSTYFTI